VWTDVTADMDHRVGYSIHVGRTSPQQQPQPSSSTVPLRNPTGKYTPGLQVLSDGTAAPYWPNVVQRKRLRITTTSGLRYVGQIKSWAPTTNGFPGSSVCVVSTVDRMDALSRIQLATPILQEILPAKPALYWPLTDAAGASAAVEQSGGVTLPVYGGGPAVTFGDAGPGFGDGTGVKFAPSSASVGQTLRASKVLNLDGYTVLVAVNAGTVLPSWGTGYQYLVGWDNPGVAASLAGYLALKNGIPEFGDYANVNTGTASIVDGGWHLLAVTRNTASGGVNTFYIDGVSQGSGPAAGAMAVTAVTVGESASPGVYSPGRFQGNIGQVAIYPTALTAAKITAIFNAIRGWPGETCSTRIARFLGYAGLTSADWNLDTSTVNVSTYPQGGKDIVTACQDMAVTEGGGSAFYILNGLARFTNRSARKPGPPTLTLDASADVDRGIYQPAQDDLSLVNSSTATRATESGAQSTQTVTDLVSADPVTGNGLTTGDVTTYTTSDADALALAQSIVAAGRTPGFRLPQITADLLTAEHSLYAAVQTTEIGSRLRTVNLPRGQAPATQLDVIVEGWTQTGNISTDSITFDTSPADTPPTGIYDDATYGRYCGTSLQVSTAYNAAAATIIVKGTGGEPMFTVDATAYPLNIGVGAEVLTVTAAPASAVTPQTLSVTRAQQGTAAAGQVVNTPVQVWPPVTYAL
jgi:hypothetical protein